jgi:N-acetylmuramoyl-L-alanine amidase
VTRNRAATRYIVIHYSATPPTDDIGARDLDRLHRAAGFLQIGYHWVIRRNGVIEPGRDEAKVGAHSPGIDASSVGVCLVGGGAGAEITPEQRESLDRLLAELRERYPEATVRGGRGFTLDTLETDEPARSDR